MSSPIATPAAGERGPRVWWLALAPAQRRTLRILLGVGIVLVLVVGVELARFLEVDNVERDDDLALVQAEARGDAAGMIAQLAGCSRDPSCVAAAKQNAGTPRLRRSGTVKIIGLESETANSPSATTGTTRLAWTVLGTLPVVQCVKVRRTGNVVSGMHVQLIALSAPIANEGICHKRTTNEVEEEEATAAEQ